MRRTGQEMLLAYRSGHRAAILRQETCQRRASIRCGHGGSATWKSGPSGLHFVVTGTTIQYKHVSKAQYTACTAQFPLRARTAAGQGQVQAAVRESIRAVRERWYRRITVSLRTYLTWLCWSLGTELRLLRLGLG